MRCSVVIPTYRRAECLRVCLEALAKQSVGFAEVIVGRREDDAESEAVLADARRFLGDALVEVVIGPGENLADSLRAVIARSTGEVVAMTDDDAEPPADWLARLLPWFKDAAVGGVGGRDDQAENPGEANDVGRLQWFGRIVGNHHLGVGLPREVDVLKGVNCAFRGSVLREVSIDPRLRGLGNVTHWELHICFAFLRRGHRLVYDPSLRLTHHVAPRQDGDVNLRKGHGFDPIGLENAAFNETLLVLEHMQKRAWPIYLAWALLASGGLSPGVLQVPRQWWQGRRFCESLQRTRVNARGRIAATWAASTKVNRLTGEGRRRASST